MAIVLTLVIVFIGGCGIATDEQPIASVNDTQTREAARGTAIGQLAPEFDLATTDGGSVSFNDLKGDPAVLVFWTAWCPTCKEEAPHINQLAADFGPKGVKVIGINIGESDARVAEGIKDFGIKYTVAKDKDSSVAKSYKVVGTPTVVILDKEGAVQYFGNELPGDYSDRLNKIIGS